MLLRIGLSYVMRLTRVGSFIVKKNLTTLKYPHTMIMFTRRVCCFNEIVNMDIENKFKLSATPN